MVTAEGSKVEISGGMKSGNLHQILKKIFQTEFQRHTTLGKSSSQAASRSICEDKHGA